MLVTVSVFFFGLHCLDACCIGWGTTKGHSRQLGYITTEFGGRRHAGSKVGDDGDELAKDEVLESDSGAGRDGRKEGDALQRILEGTCVREDSLRSPIVNTGRLLFLFGGLLITL